ncbi:MAG: NTP transferase domain-containing protein [Cyclobacteriaceae bacterium]
MNPNRAIPLYGLVLEGGQSTRMGKDKAFLQYHGQPQRDYVFRLLEKFCDRVYHSVNSQASTAEHTIKDGYPLQGPLNGILSAFKYRSDVAWITVPVDMPLVDESTIQFLLDHRDTTRVATCFYDSDGKLPEPLLTIWEPASAVLLKAFYENGKSSPREFLTTANSKLVTAPDQKALKNINKPEDFDEFSGLK